VLDVNELAGTVAKRVEQPPSIRRSSLGPDERVRTAREVVVLDVDDQERPHHEPILAGEDAIRLNAGATQR
jgi:hypothetical protein